MNETYDYLKMELTKQKKDLMFSPELLDQLNDDERREIENLILEECRKGNITSFSYIPYLKNKNYISEIPRKIIKKFPDLQKAQICRYLYDASKLYMYVDMLLEIAQSNPQVYSILIQIYKDMEDGRAKDETGKIIFRIQKTNGAIYKELYEKELLAEGIDVEPKKTGDVPSIPEEKKHLLEEMKAYRDKIVDRIKSKNIINRLDIRNGLYGFVVGDAFGVPVEFKSRSSLHNNPATTMLEYGSHPVPKGTWSDDTSMTLATMDSMSSTHSIDYNDIMKNFISWVEDANYTATDRVFDIGITTRTALSNFKRGKNSIECGLTDLHSNGNGSLMRMLPICLCLVHLKIEEQKKVEIINNISSLTHAHEISKMGCYIYYKYIESLIKGNDKIQAYNDICNIDYSKYYSKETIEVYNRILNGELSNIPIDKISSSGYVVSTLEAVLWTILNTKNYKEAIIRSVNLGDDTDTVGAITGSLAGMLYGYESIPREWLAAIPKKQYLNKLVENFNKLMFKQNEKTRKLG